jgi:hypothetical protein
VSLCVKVVRSVCITAVLLCSTLAQPPQHQHELLGHTAAASPCQYCDLVQHLVFHCTTRVVMQRKVLSQQGMQPLGLCSEALGCGAGLCLICFGLYGTVSQLPAPVVVAVLVPVGRQWHFRTAIGPCLNCYACVHRCGQAVAPSSVSWCLACVRLLVCARHCITQRHWEEYIRVASGLTSKFLLPKLVAFSVAAGCWQQLTAVCPVAQTAWHILHARGVNWKNTLVVVVLSIAPCVRCGMGWRGIQPCLSHWDAGMAHYRAIRMQARHAMGHRDGGIAHQGWMAQP